MKKPKIAIFSLTDCEGCMISILNLGQRFLDLMEKVEIAEFPLIKELPAGKDFFDIAFVEGSAITKKNMKRLKDVRKKTKILVALGACASIGGIQQIKNYRDKEELIRYVYPEPGGIDNPKILPLRDVVKIDFEIQGCPINKEDFLEICLALTNEKIPKYPQRAVCYDCQLRENDCLLQQGLPCMGPITLGGCGAPCPSSGYICDVCRGPLKEINFKNMIKALKNKADPKEIEHILERFGAKDEIYAQSSDK